MSAPLSRREFLQQTAPWLTLRNTVLVCAGLVAAVLISVAIDVFRGVGAMAWGLGFAGVMKLLGFAAAVLVIFWLIAKGSCWLEAAIRKSPPVVKAALKALGSLMSVGIWAWFGVYTYQRWERGADISGSVIAVIIFCVSRFTQERSKLAEDARVSRSLSAATQNPFSNPP